MRLAEALASQHASAAATARRRGVRRRSRGHYIDAHPSQFASIRWFGDRLAQVLERSHASQPWLAELARWEWALAASFDAPGCAHVGIEALASVAPGDWAELRLEFHPSVQRLELQTNAQALFKALSEATAGAANLRSSTGRSRGCSGGRTSRRSTVRSSPPKTAALAGHARRRHVR